MALYLIERRFAEAMPAEPPSDEMQQALKQYNDDHQLDWLFSFLSPDRRKTFCLYEAVDADALRKQAEDLGMPADVIIELPAEAAELLRAGAQGEVVLPPTG